MGKKRQGKREKSLRLCNKTASSRTGSRKYVWVLVFLLVAGTAIAVTTKKYMGSAEKISAPAVASSEKGTGSTLPLPQLRTEDKSEFAKLTDIAVKTVFVPTSELIDPKNTAKLNLLCAKDLPGSEDLNIDECLNTLQSWVERIRQETEKYRPQYKKNPADYYRSEAYFKVLTMITVLQQDFGIKYNLDTLPNALTEEELNRPFTTDSRDVFIHGLLTGKREGTCASMPVLYMIVGRMLGYPLSLVAAKNHLFIRWEDDKERINLEATGQGLSIYNDDFYKKWPLPISPEEAKADYFLKSMTLRNEYATFLINRAAVLAGLGQQDEVKRIYEKVLELEPNNPEMKRCLQNMAFQEFQRQNNIAMSIVMQRQKSVLLAQQSMEQIDIDSSKWRDEVEQQYIQMLGSNPTRAMNWRNAELAHRQMLDGARYVELRRWRNEAASNSGVAVTQVQIDTLMGRTIQRREPPPLPPQVVEMQRNNQAEMLRRRMPNLTREKALEIIDKREDDAQRMRDERWLEYCIIQARNLRTSSEEKERLVQKGFDPNKFISEKDMVTNIKVSK